MVLATLPMLVLAGVIPAEYAKQITVYHVNPLNYSYVPVNMDTGDALGDLYFDLRSVDLPIECVEDPYSHDCDNEEVVSPNLGITRLTLEVDSRYLSGEDYGKCNICVNGTDHHGHNNCTNGEYICGCGDSHTPTPCNEKQIGYWNLTEKFAQRGGCYSNKSSDVDCWRTHVVQKTGGFWYSTLKGGYCNDTNPQPGCTWRVAGNVKRINKTCSDDSIFSTVEKADAASCFQSCGAKVGPMRNTSNTCWIRCFYDTVLGPSSNNHLWKPDGGFTSAQLLSLWESPFDTCPEV